MAQSVGFWSNKSGFRLCIVHKTQLGAMQIIQCEHELWPATMTQPIHRAPANFQTALLDSSTQSKKNYRSY